MIQLGAQWGHIDSGHAYGDIVFSSQNVGQENWTNVSLKVTGHGNDLLSVWGYSDSAPVNVDNISVTAVPGPIAGAGLPVLLASAGFGAWRRRKATKARVG